MKTGCVAELSSSPLDIIGDVHGELSALESLLQELGYDDRGRHAEGRKLVFVGDVIDRGPDSPGVLRRVMRLIQSGNAQCIVGNHELNAIRNEPGKHRAGEGWWYGRHEPGYDYALVDPEEKQRSFLPFLRSLPGALERQDLRVVHACWHPPSIEKLRAATSVIEAFESEAAALESDLRDLRSQFRTAWERLGGKDFTLKDRENKIAIIPELARLDEASQMGNAVKVTTSGMECAGEDSFWAGGKWRMVRRVAWWDDYSGPPVVVGHYWRRYSAAQPAIADKADADMFGEIPPERAMGLERNVMCIDYSVGMRFEERSNARKLLHDPAAQFSGCLAALRVPEWQLVFDDGRPGLQVKLG